MKAIKDVALHPLTQVIFALYIRQLAQHPSPYIFCILCIDNLQVTECRVSSDPTFTLHLPYIMQ